MSSAQVTPSSSTVITEESIQEALAKLRELILPGLSARTPAFPQEKSPTVFRRSLHGLGHLVQRRCFRGYPMAMCGQTNLGSDSPRRSGGIQELWAYHVVVVIKRTDEYIVVTESGSPTKLCGVGSTSAGGWRNSPIISATPDTRNRRPQS